MALVKTPDNLKPRPVRHVRERRARIMPFRQQDAIHGRQQAERQAEWLREAGHARQSAEPAELRAWYAGPVDAPSDPGTVYALGEDPEAPWYGMMTPSVDDDAARHTVAPCPRCGRSDWRTADGRAYHVRVNRDCRQWRKPDRHVYAQA